MTKNLDVRKKPSKNTQNVVSMLKETLPKKQAVGNTTERPGPQKRSEKQPFPHANPPSGPTNHRHMGLKPTPIQVDTARGPPAGSRSSSNSATANATTTTSSNLSRQGRGDSLPSRLPEAKATASFPASSLPRSSIPQARAGNRRAFLPDRRRCWGNSSPRSCCEPTSHLLPAEFRALALLLRFFPLSPTRLIWVFSGCCSGTPCRRSSASRRWRRAPTTRTCSASGASTGKPPSAPPLPICAN
jgi:hypothetical protein